MIRLLGAITGSALALAALLVLVGVPQFKVEPKEIERAVLTLPFRAGPVIEQAPIDDVDTEAVEITAQEPDIEPESEALVDTAIADEAIANEAIADDAIEMLAEALQPDSLQWYAFWSPFRSEIAASGFITQLQRVTGLDYRVVKIKPGVYEVAFAYEDEAEREGKMSLIASATGLDLPQS